MIDIKKTRKVREVEVNISDICEAIGIGRDAEIAEIKDDRITFRIILEESKDKDLDEEEE